MELKIYKDFIFEDLDLSITDLEDQVSELENQIELEEGLFDQTRIKKGTIRSGEFLDANRSTIASVLRYLGNLLTKLIFKKEVLKDKGKDTSTIDNQIKATKEKIHKTRAKHYNIKNRKGKI